MVVKIIFLIAALALVYVGGSVLRSLYLVQVGKGISARAERYEQAGSESGLDILIIGDSTAYGTGARIPEESIAGRIGAVHPDATITNRAVNGLKTQQLVDRIDEFIDKKYDIIIIHIGGNDAIRRIDIETVTKPNLAAIVAHAHIHADHVVLYTTGKLGEAPLFPKFVASFLTTRALAIRKIAKEQAGEYENITYIDLIVDDADMFSQDPDMYYAKDGIHPSSEGYAVWFDRLQEEVDFLD